MFIFATTISAGSMTLTTASHVTAAVAPHADSLMIFGFLTAVAALTCCRIATVAPQARLVLAVCLALQATFASLAGAWPTGLVLLAACWLAARWWFKTARSKTINRRFALQEDVRQTSREFVEEGGRYEVESRLSRLFGPAAD